MDHVVTVLKFVFEVGMLEIDTAVHDSDFRFLVEVCKISGFDFIVEEFHCLFESDVGVFECRDLAAVNTDAFACVLEHPLVVFSVVFVFDRELDRIYSLEFVSSVKVRERESVAVLDDLLSCLNAVSRAVEFDKVVSVNELNSFYTVLFLDKFNRFFALIEKCRISYDNVHADKVDRKVALDLSVDDDEFVARTPLHFVVFRIFQRCSVEFNSENAFISLHFKKCSVASVDFFCEQSRAEKSHEQEKQKLFHVSSKKTVNKT